LNSLAAKSYPALIAGGVNSSFPEATSPIAKIFGILEDSSA